MTEPRERELKFRFRDHAEFLSALEGPGLGEFVRVDALENHYFDTADGRLVGNRIMVRIRAAADRFILGVKIGGEPRPGFFDSVELEETISRETARRIFERPEDIYSLDLPPVRALRERFDVLPLVSLGCLEVERSVRQADPHRLEFDRLTFPDGTGSFELDRRTGRAFRCRQYSQ